MEDVKACGAQFSALFPPFCRTISCLDTAYYHCCKAAACKEAARLSSSGVVIHVDKRESEKTKTILFIPVLFRTHLICLQVIKNLRIFLPALFVQL